MNHETEGELRSMCGVYTGTMAVPTVRQKESWGLCVVYTREPWPSPQWDRRRVEAYVWCIHGNHGRPHSEPEGELRPMCGVYTGTMAFPTVRQKESWGLCVVYTRAPWPSPQWDRRRVEAYVWCIHGHHGLPHNETEGELRPMCGVYTGTMAAPTVRQKESWGLCVVYTRAPWPYPQWTRRRVEAYVWCIHENHGLPHSETEGELRPMCGVYTGTMAFPTMRQKESWGLCVVYTRAPWPSPQWDRRRVEVYVWCIHGNHGLPYSETEGELRSMCGVYTGTMAVPTVRQKESWGLCVVYTREPWPSPQWDRRRVEAYVWCIRGNHGLPHSETEGELRSMCGVYTGTTAFPTVRQKESWGLCVVYTREPRPSLQWDRRRVEAYVWCIHGNHGLPYSETEGELRPMCGVYTGTMAVPTVRQKESWGLCVVYTREPWPSPQWDRRRVEAYVWCIHGNHGLPYSETEGELRPMCGVYTGTMAAPTVSQKESWGLCVVYTREPWPSPQWDRRRVEAYVWCIHGNHGLPHSETKGELRPMCGVYTGTMAFPTVRQKESWGLCVVYTREPWPSPQWTRRRVEAYVWCIHGNHGLPYSETEGELRPMCGVYTGTTAFPTVRQKESWGLCVVYTREPRPSLQWVRRRVEAYVWCIHGNHGLPYSETEGELRPMCGVYTGTMAFPTVRQKESWGLCVVYTREPRPSLQWDRRRVEVYVWCIHGNHGLPYSETEGELRPMGGVYAGTMAFPTVSQKESWGLCVVYTREPRPSPQWDRRRVEVYVWCIHGNHGRPHSETEGELRSMCGVYTGTMAFPTVSQKESWGLCVVYTREPWPSLQWVRRRVEVYVWCIHGNHGLPYSETEGELRPMCGVYTGTMAFPTVRQKESWGLCVVYYTREPWPSPQWDRRRRERALRWRGRTPHWAQCSWLLDLLAPRGGGGLSYLNKQTKVICKTQGPLILTLQGNWGALIALSDPSERRQALCIRSILPYFTGPFLAPVQRVPAYNINTAADLK